MLHACCEFVNVIKCRDLPQALLCRRALRRLLAKCAVLNRAPFCHADNRAFSFLFFDNLNDGVVKIWEGKKAMTSNMMFGGGCWSRFAEAGARCAQIMLHQRRLEQRLCLHYWAGLEWAVKMPCVCVYVCAPPCTYDDMVT